MLRTLIHDPSLRASLGQKARERAHDFSIDTTVNAYEELFIHILRTKGVA
jgi:hypothetical protein